MKLTINEKLCGKYGLTVSQVLLMLSVCKKDLGDTLAVLLRKGIILKQGSEYTLSPLWKDTLDKVLDSSAGLEGDDWYKSLAAEFAKAFPQGKMPNTAYYYRCNTSELVNKFKKFFLTHSEYKPSDEIRERIIEAARRYNREMDYNPRYRTLAKYFISKMKPVMDEDGIVHNEEVSQLASYLENEESPDSSVSGEWHLSQRN